MATVKEGKGKAKNATAFRLAPSTLARLKHEAGLRCVTQTALITSLIEQLGVENGPARAHPRIAKAAAIACLAALDLLDMASPAPDQLATAASKLEEFIDLLDASSGS